MSLPGQVARLELSAVSRFLETAGDTTTLQVRAFDRQGKELDLSSLPLEWSSSRPQDFAVDAKGQVKALVEFGYSLIGVRLKGTDLAASLQINVNSFNVIDSGVSSVQTSPQIRGLSASQGVAGSTLTLTGSGFSADLAGNVVKLGDTVLVVTAATSTSLTVTVPDVPLGDYTLKVTTNGKTSSGSAFTVQPAVTGVSPAADIIGSSITIQGTGFNLNPANNSVKFGNTVAVVTASTTNSLTVTVPAGLSRSQTLTVSVNSIPAVGNASFAIKPNITSIVPNAGVTTTSVTITGSGFDTVPANDTVMVGLNQATVTGIPSNTSLTATVTGQSLDYGLKNVTVGVNGQTSSPGTFTQRITSPCVVNAFTPPTGDPLFFYDCLDAAPTGTNGVDYNNVNQVVDRFGQPAKAYAFNGTNSFRRINGVDMSPNLKPELTISVWSRVPVVPASGVYSVIGQDDTPFDRSIMLDNRSTGGFGWSAFAGTQAVIGASAAVANQWVMLTAVYNQVAATAAFYVNNTLVKSVTSATLTNGTNYVMLGKNAKVGANEFFPGEIDDVLLFGKALSAADVDELYQRTKP